ncbi:YdgA family protein [Campylobacter ureolyticus]|uniref:YdgA family protein n=1 Tax=Campylobacter ureolyticus TaxID=827 RepID=UPI00215B602D|nr:YdgA family protein [Campylobacter ureolyticus]MCR8700109.1 YdgA family protein [Campylobacter ureolyticus]
MKKVLVAILFIILVLAGVFWIVSSKTTDKIANEYISSFNMNMPKELDVKHSYTKEAGILHIVSDINYTKEFLNKEFLNIFDDDFIIRIKVDIQNSVLNLIKGYEASGTMEALSYQDEIKKLFNSTKFLKFTLKGDKNSLHNGKFILNEINFKDDDGKIHASEFVLNMNFKKNLLKSLTLTQKGSSLNTDEISASYDELFFEYNYDKPFDINEILTHIANSNSNSSIKNLKIKFDDFDFFVANISQEDKINDNNTKKFEFNSILNANGIQIKFNDERLPIDKFGYSITLENIGKSFIDEFLKADFTKLSDDEIDKFGLEFLAQNPKISVNNFGFNDNDGKNFNLNLKAGLENFDESKLLNILNYAFLNGDLKVSKKYFELFFDDLMTKEEMFKDAIVASGILKDEKDSFVTNFVYDKSKLDIIVNDNVSLMGLFLGFPLGSLEVDEDDFKQSVLNLKTLVFDIAAFYTSQAKFADEISYMTNVKVDEISNSQAFLKVKGKKCIKISTKDNSILEVSRGDDKDDETCIDFYKLDEVKELIKEYDLTKEIGYEFY